MISAQFNCILNKGDLLNINRTSLTNAPQNKTTCVPIHTCCLRDLWPQELLTSLFRFLASKMGILMKISTS